MEIEMATSEIEKLEQQIKELQEKRQSILNEKRKEKLSEVKIIVRDYGFTATDLGLSAKKKKSTDKPKAEAQYVNPKDPSQTWAGGKGRKPAWVKDHLAKGGKIEDLEIKNRLGTP